MKRFIPLLFTCLIVLTSMSDCEKWYENNEESIYVDVNGKTLGYTMPHSFILGGGYVFASVRHWDEDSLAFWINASPVTIFENKYKDAIDYNVCIHTKGDIELNKWYPLFRRERKDTDCNYALWYIGGDIYSILDGSLKITKIEDGRREMKKYSGEFWFNAVNDNDPDDILIAKKGWFKNLRAHEYFDNKQKEESDVEPNNKE